MKTMIAFYALLVHVLCVPVLFLF